MHNMYVYLYEIYAQYILQVKACVTSCFTDGVKLQRCWQPNPDFFFLLSLSLNRWQKWNRTTDVHTDSAVVDKLTICQMSSFRDL